jgi:hypothetical protein
VDSTAKRGNNQCCSPRRASTDVRIEGPSPQYQAENTMAGNTRGSECKQLVADPRPYESSASISSRGAQECSVLLPVYVLAAETMFSLRSRLASCGVGSNFLTVGNLRGRNRSPPPALGQSITWSKTPVNAQLGRYNRVVRLLLQAGASPRRTTVIFVDFSYVGGMSVCRPAL